MSVRCNGVIVKYINALFIMNILGKHDLHTIFHIVPNPPLLFLNILSQRQLASCCPLPIRCTPSVPKCKIIFDTIVVSNPMSIGYIGIFVSFYPSLPTHLCARTLQLSPSDQVTSSFSHLLVAVVCAHVVGFFLCPGLTQVTYTHMHHVENISTSKLTYQIGFVDYQT